MKSVVILSVFLYLVCFSISIQSSKPERDEDLTFLEQDEKNDAELSDSVHPFGHPRDYENYDDLEEGDDLSTYTDDDGSYSGPEVDETHVLVLKESNFSEFLQKNRFVMVEFYAPWCGHCQALAPEYAEAAAELKDEDVVLAKIDATEETELAQKFDVQGFPTVYFFVDGTQKPYTGHRTKDSIVSWLKKKIGPVLQNITTIEDAESILASPDVLVLGYLESLVLILFATSSDSEKFYPTFLEAAKTVKGKLLCVYVELDNEDVGKEVSEYFGVNGASPRVIAYTGNDDARKFLLDGELTISSIKSFGENFLQDNLRPFYKSDPIPEKNDGDVKIVVGNNFDEIVLDESKDVLLEIYAPWCGHCQSLEPIYNKLGQHLRGIDSVVVAKMDGTTNEHPRAKPDGFPTLLFFPAGNKSFDPITCDTDRTVVAYYKFLKKHVSIPFKLQKPAASQQRTAAASDSTASHEASSNDVKDEL